MAITVTGPTVHTQTGAGTWISYGGGPSVEDTENFFSSTSSRAKSVSSERAGMAYEVAPGGLDLSNTIIVVRWGVFAGAYALASRNDGGVSIIVEDTTGNQSEWYIEGGNTFGGGWRVSRISTSRTESANNGTPANMSTIRYIGVIFDVQDNIASSVNNCFIDSIVSLPNAGITVSGDSDQVLLDLLIWEFVNDYGLVSARSTVVLVSVPITLNPNATGFKSTDWMLVLEELHYSLGALPTAVIMDLGISSTSPNLIEFDRSSIKIPREDLGGGQESNRFFDMSGATAFSFSNAIIEGADGTPQPCKLGGSTNTYTSTVFSGCGKITHTGATISGFVITAGRDPTGAYQYTTDSNIERGVVTMNEGGHGFDILTAPTSPTPTVLENIIFMGYGPDDTATSAVKNNTGHDVLLSGLGTTDGVTVNSTTNTVFEKTRNIVFTGIISGSRLYVEATDTVGSVSDGDVLVNEIVTSDPFIYPHSYEGDLTIRFVIANASGTTKYSQVRGTGTVTNSGFSFTAIQILD